MNNKNVIVIGAGLAGSEAAWQLANRGIHVDLYEMRPVKSSPAHQTDQFAELVCSNSLRAGNIENAVGLFLSCFLWWSSRTSFIGTELFNCTIFICLFNHYRTTCFTEIMGWLIP